MRVRTIIAAVFSVLLAGTAAQAQGFPGGGMGGRFPGGGMGGRGGRGGGFARYRAPLDIPDLGNPVRRFILANKADLKLSDAEVTRVDSVARSLDSQNDTLVAVVRRALGWERDTVAGRPRVPDDSVQDLPATEQNGAGRPEDIRLRDRLNAVKPQIKQIKQNDDAAWKAATALLDKNQRKQADKLRSDSQKQRQQQRSPFPRGQRGGGMGGPDDF